MKFLTRWIIFITVISSCSNEKFHVENNTQSEKVTIYLPEFDVHFTPDSCQKEIDIESFNPIGELHINLENCKGKMKFSFFDSTGQLICKGAYIEAVDTLKKYSIGKSAINDEKSISILKYFQPLPNGIWEYYKRDKVVKSKEYSFGISKD